MLLRARDFSWCCVSNTELCVCVVLLCRLLNTFQSTLDEVSIIALPPNHSTGTASQAAAQRCVRLQSFYDPAKGVCFAQGQALISGNTP
jgi:hypothetical protein